MRDCSELPPQEPHYFSGGSSQIKPYILYGTGPLYLYASVQYEEDIFPIYYCLNGDNTPTINKEAEEQIYKNLNCGAEEFARICNKILPNYVVSTEEISNFCNNNENYSRSNAVLHILADKIIEKYENAKRIASTTRLCT